MTSRIRIGAVAYLNTKPLVLGLEEGMGRDRLDLSFDVPAALATRLAVGDVDLALLPVVELARIPGLEVIPGISISARGAAASVLLVTRTPLDRVRRVALDAESRTSNALVQVLFAESWGTRPEFVVGSADLAATLASSEAAVRIGDKALFDPLPPGCEAIDLGEAWTASTGLPFVFAVWAARPGVVDRDLYRVLHASRRRGVAELRRIADGYAWRGTTYPERSFDYLSRRMVYRLGAPEVEGLERFLSAAHRLGLTDRPAPVRLARFSETTCDAASVAAERMP